MKFFRFVSTLIFTFCLFVFSTQTIFANTKVQIPQDADFWSDFPHEDLANFLVENMNNDELLAQITGTGFNINNSDIDMCDWNGKVYMNYPM